MRHRNLGVLLKVGRRWSLLLLGLLIAIAAVRSAAAIEIKDIEITLAVDRHLTRAESVASHLIDIRTDEGVVTLTGSVDNLLAFEKSVAQDIALRVRGIVAVENDLSVAEKWTAKQDWVHKRDIANEIWWDPFLSSDDVMINVNEGVVTLIGVVDNLRMAAGP